MAAEVEIRFDDPKYYHCLVEAPNPYRSAMHFTHFLTVPLYILSIYVLIFRSPKPLKTYRNYLLWHTIGNLIFELYISILMLPVTYLPYPVFRGAGVLKHIGIHGIIQFYILVIVMIHTGVSILELFKYRCDVTIQEEHNMNKKILHRIVIFCWIIVIAIPVLCFSTLWRCMPKQATYKHTLYHNSPNISIEVLCYTSVTAPPLIDVVFTPLMTMIISAILTAGVIIPHTFLTIWKQLEHFSKHLSVRTVKLQKMLVLSLFIQAVIHGVMLGAPLVGFIYAIVFTLPDNNIAYILLLLVSFHGSISTIAMIFFTKPIRQEVYQIFQSILPIRENEKPDTVFVQSVTESSTKDHGTTGVVN